MGGYGAAIRAYSTFQGRASRAEFWQFTLVVFAFSVVAYFIFGPGPGRSIWPTLLFLIVIVAHVVPYFAVLARRLHDLDASGWWALIGVIPVVGLTMLVPAAVRGTQGPNRFGSDPSGQAASAAANSDYEHGLLEAEHLPFSRTSQPAEASDTVAKLERLAQLRSNGSLSESEFDAMKTRLLMRDGLA